MLADNDDVKIGKAMNSYGLDAPAKRVFADMRLYLLTQEFELSDINKETFEPIKLSVDALRYTYVYSLPYYTYTYCHGFTRNRHVISYGVAIWFSSHPSLFYIYRFT